MFKKVAGNKNSGRKDMKIKRKGRGKSPKMTDGARNTSVLKTGRRSMRPSARTKEPFPWVQLPQELQMKILQNLDAVDLDNCWLLNRATFELIRRNERLMKRRVIDRIEIRKCYGAVGHKLVLSVHSYELGNMRRFEEEINEDDEDEEMKEELDSLCFGPDMRAFYAIPCCLPKILKNAEVGELLIRECTMNDDLLVSISSCLPHAGCKIRTLEIINTTMNGITSSMFLRFLHMVAPKKVVLRNITACLQETFEVEIFQFIVSRPCFSVVDFMDSELDLFTIAIDDDILRQLTAVDFEIGVPNLITLDGLKSFIGSLGSRKEKVHGVIHTTSRLNSISFSTPPNVQLHILPCWTDSDSVEFWFDPEDEF